MKVLEMVLLFLFGLNMVLCAMEHDTISTIAWVHAFIWCLIAILRREKQ